MLVYNRTEEVLQQVFGERFPTIHLTRYKEFEEDDSLLIIAKTA